MAIFSERPNSMLIPARYKEAILPTVAALYFLTAELGHALSFPGNVATFWPPAGIALAAYLCVPPKYWGRVLLGTLLANLGSDCIFHEKHIGISILFWVANTCESIIAFTLVRLFGNARSFLQTLQSVMYFILVPCTIGTAVGACLGAAVVSLAFGESYFETWRVWWSGDYIGMLVVFPFVWLTSGAFSTSNSVGRIAEFGGLSRVIEFLVFLTLVAGCCWYIFGFQNQRLAYAVFPVLLALTVRFGYIGSASGILVLAIPTVAHTAAGNGLFGEIENLTSRATVLHIYLFVTSTTFLTLASSIGQRHTAERKGATSERMLKAAMRGGEVGLWDWDIKGNIVFWSDECHHQLGETPGKLRSFADWELRLHPEDLDSAKDNVSRAISSRDGLYKSTFRMRHENGSYRWILSRGQIEFDEEHQPIRMSGSHIDVTEINELKDQLQASLNLQGATDGSWYWNITKNTVQYSQRFLELLGFQDASIEEFPPTIESLKSCVHIEDQENHWRDINSHINDGTTYESEFRMQTKDGKFRWFQGRGQAMQDENGKPVRMAGSIYDITDRKRAELLLTKSNEDLAQFANVASHDLQEPLRAVMGFCQMLQSRYSKQIDEQGKLYIQHAVEGTQRMKNLIDDLLHLSRVGRGDIETVVTDLNTIVSSALQSLSVLIKEKRAEIVVGELHSLPAEKSLLTQLFQNLIANGVKFHRPNETPKISISSERIADTIVIRISDQGIGIEPKHQNRIFELFQRLHHREQIPGTGIGLAICMRIVQRHGGSIVVESEPNQGSTFIVTLPAQT